MRNIQGTPEDRMGPNHELSHAGGSVPARASAGRLAGLRKAIKKVAPDPHRSLTDLRDNFESASSKLELAPSEVISVEDGPVEMEWVLPTNFDKDAENPLKAALIYLHGGGFFLGSRRTGRPLASWISHYTGLPVANVGYSLTPEAPFGAAVDDVTRLVDWLVERRGLEKYVLVGDSAGATLALMSAIQLTNRTEALEPAGLMLISPSARPNTSSESHIRNTDVDPQLPPAFLRKVAEMAGVDPSADLWPGLEFSAEANLPPTIIHVGTDEVLLDDSIEIARRLLTQGTEVTLRGWPDMMHVWHVFAPRLEDANRALADLGNWARRVFELPET